MKEINALQNAANGIGIVIHEKIEQDKRKTIIRFFAAYNGVSVSPVLDYEQMNHFLLGWIKCTQYCINNLKQTK